MEDVAIQIDGETGKHDISEKDEKPSERVITSAMVDSWCNSIQENGSLSAVRSVMRAFKTACHYGDDSGDDPATKFCIMSSSVFNKIMLFVLSEMDSILRKLLKLPSSGGKKETIIDLMSTKQWKNFNHFVKSYLGNALHVLNQMTDTEMISFTLRRLKYSSIFLVAFPSLLRRYIKVCVVLFLIFWIQYIFLLLLFFKVATLNLMHTHSSLWSSTLHRTRSGLMFLLQMVFLIQCLLA